MRFEAFVMLEVSAGLQWNPLQPSRRTIFCFFVGGYAILAADSNGEPKFH